MTEVVSHISFSWVAGYLESIFFPLTIFITAITTLTLFRVKVGGVGACKMKHFF